MFQIEEIKRFLIFGVIGGFNAILDTLIWRFLVWLLDKNPKVQTFLTKVFRVNKYGISQFVAFLISATSSYFLNSTFTFSDSDRTRDVSQVFRFFSVALFSLLISVITIHFLTENKWIKNKIIKFPLLNKYWHYIAKIITIGITMITNFIGYKLLVF